MPTTPLKIGDRTFQSRLMVGTGRYANAAVAREAIAASEAEIVTVAVRRVDLDKDSSESIWAQVDLDKHTFLPNTAGCVTVDETVRTARLAREVGMGDLIKVEIIGCPKTLYPDNEATLEASKILLDEGFTVLPYIIDDVVLCKKLADMGCHAVMPLASALGSGLGLRNPLALQLIIEAMEEYKIPVIVDAGIGTPSDAVRAMELGCDAVLMNTAIALSDDPVLMAKAMRLALVSGRKAFIAGRMPMKRYATASSPIDGLIS